MNKIRYLTIPEVISINVSVINKYSPGEHIGIKSRSLLESAVYRPQTSAFCDDAYPTLVHKAAALFESIGQNHPFQNGNKRTAFTALVVFLHLNGYGFKMETKQAEDFTVDMVQHQYTFNELAKTIETHTEQKI